MRVDERPTWLLADGVAAFRGERLVLRGVSLAVPPGGALLLLGPNGSGKSTLLRRAGRAEAAGCRDGHLGRDGDGRSPISAMPTRSSRADRAENLRFAAAGRRSARRWTRSAWPRWPTCRRACCPPGSAAAWRWPGCR